MVTVTADFAALVSSLSLISSVHHDRFLNVWNYKQCAKIGEDSQCLLPTMDNMEVAGNCVGEYVFVCFNVRLLIPSH